MNDNNPNPIRPVPGAGGTTTQTANNEGDGPTILLETAQSFIYNDHRGRETDPILPKFEDPTFELPEQPRHVHIFRDILHTSLIEDLKQNRVLILSAFREKAALATAYSILSEEDFKPLSRRALDPARDDLADRSDINIHLFARTEMSSREREVIVVEIKTRCDFLDSMLSARDLYAGSIAANLKKRSSYIIITTETSLLTSPNVRSGQEDTFVFRSVSFLSYLLSGTITDNDRKVEIEAFLESERVRRIFRKEEDLLLAVESIIAIGAGALEDFVRDLEAAPSDELPEKWLQRLRPSGHSGEVLDGSEAHRVVAFIGAFLPELSPSDFDWLTTSLLTKEARTIEQERRVVAADGTVHSIREVTEESWAIEWRKNSDRILRECHLKTSISSEGRWSIGFSEPFLRSALRAYFEQNCTVFLLRVAERLQSPDILFARAISPTLLQGILRILVERAIADPYRFGVDWLVDLVVSFRTGVEDVVIPDGLPAKRLVEALTWLAIADASLMKHFYSRLALLIREMLETEKLRPMIEALLDTLVALPGEDKLRRLVVDLVFELTRRLRFAPHFDASRWIQRLLDQGTGEIRLQIATRVLSLAMESGARVYEFLAIVHGWLPKDGRESARLSNANRLSLEFPYALNLKIARGLREESYGQWPSPHLLFAPLINDATEKRERIQMLVGWLLHPNGTAIFPTGHEDSTLTPEVIRLRVIADLLEHWSCVLVKPNEVGMTEANALLELILSELAHITKPHERSWIQRFWKQRQAEYTSKLGQLPREERPIRLDLVNRRTKLESLCKRLAILP